MHIHGSRTYTQAHRESESHSGIKKKHPAARKLNKVLEKHRHDYSCLCVCVCCVWCYVKSSSLCTQIKDYQNVNVNENRELTSKGRSFYSAFYSSASSSFILSLRCLLHCKHTLYISVQLKKFNGNLRLNSYRE